MIAHPSATTAPQKLAEYTIHENPPGIAGSLVEGLTYYDAFVLNNKKCAIFAHYGRIDLFKSKYGWYDQWKRQN